MRNSRWPLRAAGLLSLLAAWAFWSKTPSTARTVLAFLPPALGDQKALGDLASWSNPVTQAENFLLGQNFIESIRPYLMQEQESERQHYLAAALALTEDGHLQLQIADGGLLTIEVRSSDRAFALAFSRAVVKTLRKFFHEQRVNSSINTASLAEMTQAKEELGEAETKALRAGLEGPGLSGEVKLRYALQHYREGLQVYRSASERVRRWELLLDQNSPEFVVVSGPSYASAGNSW